MNWNNWQLNHYIILFYINLSIFIKFYKNKQNNNIYLIKLSSFSHILKVSKINKVLRKWISLRFYIYNFYM